MVPSQNGLVGPTPDGWEDHEFTVLMPAPNPASEIQPTMTNKLLEILAKPRTQLVMAPERKITLLRSENPQTVWKCWLSKSLTFPRRDKQSNKITLI